MSLPDYYVILGVPYGATPEQIRKRYRELARQYHPDVNPSPSAKEEFIRIQEAYRVLIDPERRRHYNAMLAMARQQQQASQARSSPRPASGRPSTGSSQSPATSEVQRLIQQAELAFVSGRLRDAFLHARRVVKLQPRNATAHMIMGDVYRLQGQIDAALHAYTIALQLDPHNVRLQRKFERLVSVKGEDARATATRAYPRSRLPALQFPSELNRYAIQSLGLSAVFFLVFLANLFPGQPTPFLAWLPMISHWSLNLIFLLLLDGLLTGVLLSASGWVVPLEDALPWRSEGKADGHSPLPIRRYLSAGTGLVAIASICFPIAALIYAVLGVMQNAFNRSLNRAFLFTAGLTVGFALAYPFTTLQVLGFGGNLLFIGMLCGWLIADAFRIEG